VPKHVGVLIIVMNCILLSAFLAGCIDFKNMHSTNNKNSLGCDLRYNIGDEPKIELQSLQ
jgi:hypothetical protein